MSHRDGLEKKVMGKKVSMRSDKASPDASPEMLVLKKKFRCDQTMLVLTSARAGAPKRGARARALI